MDGHGLDDNQAAHAHAEGHVHSSDQSRAHANRKGFRISDYYWHIGMFILCLAIALVMFYPLTLHMNSNAPGTGADTYQNLWDIWWVSYATFHLHTGIFYTKILFWPIGSSLVSSTIAPLIGILSAPLQAAGTVFAYNMMFFLGFALSGLTMFILADYLTKSKHASAVAGIVYAFSAFHIAQSYSHIHFISIEWVPLFAYFLLKVVNDHSGFRSINTWIDIAGMSISFALTTLMGNVEQTIILAVAFIFLIVAMAIVKGTRRKVLSLRFALSMAIFIILAFVVGAWNFIPIIHMISAPGGLSSVNYLNSRIANQQWSASAIGLFIPSYFNGIAYSHGVPNWIYQLFAADPVERVDYIGYAVLALSVYAVYKYKRDMAIWAAGAVIFIWLALGPSFGLFAAYHSVPLFHVVREPGRFQLISTMFMALLAGFGAKALLTDIAPNHRSEKRHRNMLYAALAIIIIIMLIENNGIPTGSVREITNVSVPALYGDLAQQPGNFSVMGLPALPASANNTYLYQGMDTFYTSITHKPLVGGYVGRQNATSTLLLYNIPLAEEASTLIANGSAYYDTPVVQNYTNQTLLTLYNYNTEYIILHEDAFTSQELNEIGAYLEKVFGQPVYVDNGTVAFQTETAINRSIFRSFVSYPVLTQWNPVSAFLNGSYQGFWIPQSPGMIVTYAPYPKNTIVSSPSDVFHVNGTIRFTALSQTPQKMYIAEPTGRGNSTALVAEFNITSTPETYSVNQTFESGPVGNIFYFVHQYNNTELLIGNLTIN